MAKLTSEERIMRVLRREEPDRVPHFEWLIDRRVREALAPGCTDTNDFAVRMGLFIGVTFYAWLAIAFLEYLRNRRRQRSMSEEEVERC